MQNKGQDTMPGGKLDELSARRQGLYKQEHFNEANCELVPAQVHIKEQEEVPYVDPQKLVETAEIKAIDQIQRVNQSVNSHKTKHNNQDDIIETTRQPSAQVLKPSPVQPNQSSTELDSSIDDECTTKCQILPQNKKIRIAGLISLLIMALVILILNTDLESKENIVGTLTAKKTARTKSTTTMKALFQISRKTTGNSNMDTTACPDMQNMDEVTFLNRHDGSVNFIRGWAEYKAGFGHPQGEFWLGLELLHNITTARKFGLRVDFGDFWGKVFQSSYSNMSIGPESGGFQLSISGYDTRSTGGNSLTNSIHAQENTVDNMKFSTLDIDNDLQHGYSCTNWRGGGGWWWNKCGYANPTGQYLIGDQKNQKGINWYHAKGRFNSYTNMKLTLIKA